MNKAFTLIELLIVIAIISVFLSVAVISFSKTSDGAQDSRNRLAVEQLRPTAAIVKSASTPRSYEGFCMEPDVVDIKNSIEGFICKDDVNTWYIAFPLKAAVGGVNPENAYRCVDARTSKEYRKRVEVEPQRQPQTVTVNVPV